MWVVRAVRAMRAVRAVRARHGGGGGRGGKAAIGVVLWAVGVVRAVRTRGGVGMHWQPLNTLICKMQAIGKAKGRRAIGR